MAIPLLLACVGCVPQDPAVGSSAAPGSLAVQLTARVPTAGERLAWSPKGATVPLVAKDGVLQGAAKHRRLPGCRGDGSVLRQLS